MGPDDTDVWRAGPLDPSDLGWLRELAAAFPPAAHALAVPSKSLSVPMHPPTFTSSEKALLKHGESSSSSAASPLSVQSPPSPVTALQNSKWPISSENATL